MCLQIQAGQGGQWRSSSPREKNPAMPAHVSLGLGAASAFAGGVVGYPLTVVRTRLMVQGMGGAPGAHQYQHSRAIGNASPFRASFPSELPYDLTEDSRACRPCRC
jgi:hypothetical protein